MSDQTLLSKLCSVCNIKESKYTCPGCSARTCSLPCVKRHKQWAQCSGKRDPTKYVKKSELATPAGIDHDYNFLSGIERDLDKSEKSVTERGLDVGHKTKLRSDQAHALGHHLAAAGVKVIWAPKGMSRSKENKTYRSKSGNRNIIWTVELIGPDKARTLVQRSSVEPIYRLHPLHQSSNPKKKRKREAGAPVSTDCVTVDDSVDSEALEPTSATVNCNSAATGQETESTTTQMARSYTANQTDQSFKYYLSRPRTSSTRRVLIPLSPTDTLGDALRGSTVEEFPTIYFFPSTISELPDGFMLDADYRKEEGEQQREFEELMKDVDPEILKRLKDDGTGRKDDEEVDSKRILDVLEQDLGGL